MKSKKLTKSQKQNWKTAFWILVGVSLIVFGALLVILRTNIKEISKDPSVTSLTNDSALKMIQIINLNKNRFADNPEGCWNQKNPYTNCIKENTIESGNYTIHGDKDGAMWLEGPHGQTIINETFELSEKQVRDVLGGFMLSDYTYSQMLRISYPDERNKMEVLIETMNDHGDRSYQQLNIEGYPLTIIQPNE